MADSGIRTAATRHLHEQAFHIFYSLFIKRCAGIFIFSKIIYQPPSFANWIMMYVSYFFKNKFHRLTFLSIKTFFKHFMPLSFRSFSFAYGTLKVFK